MAEDNTKFNVGAYNAEATLTDAPTISWDVSTSPVAKVTLGGNRTLGAATNAQTGQFVSILFIQDGTGSRTITFTTAPASGASIFIVEISGAVGGPMYTDINGSEFILDVDGDTTITADTDDQIDFKAGGTDRFVLSSANAKFNVGAYNAEATLTDASTISWDVSTSPVAKVTLGGNRTLGAATNAQTGQFVSCLLYTSPSPRDGLLSRMPSSA